MFRNNYYRHFIVEDTFREKTEYIDNGGKGHFKTILRLIRNHFLTNRTEQTIWMVRGEKGWGQNHICLNSSFFSTL